MSDDLERLLNYLHSETANALLEKIRSGNAAAADLNAAINLLKHNGVTVTPSGKKTLDDITASIEAYEEDQEYFHH